MSLDGGDLIRICRKRAGMTQRELAAKVGITATSLWRYETGKDMPRWDKVVWCLSVCGYTFEIKEIRNDKGDTDSDGAVGTSDVRIGGGDSDPE